MNIRNLIPFGKKNIAVRREEEHPFVQMQREMNRIFDAFSRSWDLAAFPGSAMEFSPRLDVTEDAKSFIVTAELPGLTEKDIDLSITGDLLTLRGEKRQEKEDAGRSYYYAERSYGSFSRSIPLPQQVDADRISAHFRNGVLAITLPKTAAAATESRKVPVTS